jgi:hypothetical protein
MPKSKRKTKKQQNREKRDFAEIAFAASQQPTGIKSKPRYSAQRHSHSGRGK